jgi:uncharacterized protein
VARPTIHIGNASVPPGTRADTELPVARLPTGTWLSLPLAILNGQAPGPRVWISATLHGDEVNGIEIIRRTLRRLAPEKMHGCLVAAPVVNVFGFIQQTRYLPDRRDLNRSFPGSKGGSLAARLANLFMTEIATPSGYGIDLHTGSNHRTNLPQVRANLDDPETRRIAMAFGAPLVSRGPELKGSLRWAATRRGIHVLTFEGGEPLRFDEASISAGVDGILRVLVALEMIELRISEPVPAFEAASTHWVRAPRSGLFRHEVELGAQITRGEPLGRISDPLAAGRERPVRASHTGMVIGFTNNPLVHQGDALIHLARPAVPAGRG